jgi:uncharacterized membrane-anchored protein
MKMILKTSALALAVALAVSTAGAGFAKDDPRPAAAGPGQPQEIAPAQIALQKSLHPQTGDVRIPGVKAVLHLGDNYYFLPADEAKRVLVEAWGNPPQAGEGVLGLVLEKGSTIFNETWGAVITYEETGHVADADAQKQDYAQVLKDRQEAVEASNATRKEQGYAPMHLVGWAQPPSYDPSNHSLIWAREIKIDGEPGSGLNYDVRLLGRTGVLSMNMLASMNSIGDVRAAAQQLGKAATFEPGSAYADYNASTDKTAEYGLAGLVAGGAAVAVASKLGLLGGVLAFGKWILIGLAAVGASVVGFFKKMFGRNRDKDLL